MLFHTTQLEGGQKLAVGQFRQAIFIACNACKLFDMTVPRRHVFVANGPVYGKTIALRPFKIESTIAPFYDVGLTWASGLYQLRSEFDTVKNADLLVMKSLFFLTPTPGYIEAVEALVKADKALYDGAHVTRIRTLFYTELKFINGQTSPFRDTDTLVAEVGFKSCTSLSGPLSTHPLASLGVFGVWIASVLSFGRVYRRRKESR